MKESFIFYRSFYEALKELSKEDRVEIIDAICELALNETEVELKGGIQKAMFALIKPQIEANNKRYVNGCKAKTKHASSEPKAKANQSEEFETPKKSESEANVKQSRSKTEANVKQDASKHEANENVNDNVNVNDNENDKENEEKEKASSSSDDTCVRGEKDDKAEKIPYDGIIGYLNEKTGKSFTAQTQDTRSKIRARWREGFRVVDFKHVIDVKTEQWLNDEKMYPYLRPKTLFGTNFEGYLQEYGNSPKKMNTGLPEWYDQKPDTPVDPDVLKRALKAQQRASEERT